MKGIRAGLSCIPMLLLAGYASAVPMTLRSAEVKPNATVGEPHVYKGFGCNGGNASPSLVWKDAPAGAKSFAVTVYDPDAPTGSGWWHWVVFNLPANTTSLPLGAGDPSGSKLPQGAVQARTDYGTPGYGGPCPPPGDKAHRYIFTVYALKVDKLDLDANASPAMVGFMIHANKLAKAQFIGRYARK
jgi:Raf kinase inhibitor-like YbhB/YbcL family protein